MNKERIALGLATAASLSLFAWNLSLQGEVASLRTEKSERQAAAQERIEARASAPDREARPGRIRTQRAPRPPGAPHGGPPPARVPHQAAADAPAAEGEAPRPEPDWGAIRAEMETQTIDTVEAYAIQHGWEPATTEEVLAILLDSGDQIGALWGSVHEGDTTHYRARKEMMEIREAAGADIESLIGAEAHEALEEHLFEARRETWRRAH